MSQHAQNAACGESDGLWLPLIEYSVRAGVSLSTIRRKIKTNSIPFRLEKGKYLILYSNGSETASKPSLSMDQPMESEREEAPRRPQPPTPIREKKSQSQNEGDSERWAVPLIERSVKLVSEAFEKTLHEKDERIRLLEQRNQELEERLDELRLLVRVLEEKYEVRY
jgi:DNA-binding transcriptional MerR regulator